MKRGLIRKEDIWEAIQPSVVELVRRMTGRHARQLTGGRIRFLTAAFTSTAWDGDARSTTSRTLIDLSAVFGVPAEVRAVYVRTTIRDSGSLASDCTFNLYPANTGGVAYAHRCSGLANDAYSNMQGWVPCDGNGDIYFGNTASGAGTMDITLEILGWQER